MGLARRNLQYLLSSDKIDHLFIALDNIDENNQKAVKNGRDFAVELSHITRNIVSDLVRQGRNKASCVFVPVRIYTANFYFKQDHYAIKDLPFISNEEVIKVKLKGLNWSLKNAANSIAFNVHWSQYAGKRSKVNEIRYHLSTDRIGAFIDKLISLLFNDEPDFVELMNALSSNNLKILVENFYYFLHSNKLPLIPLFQMAFRPFYSNERIQYTGMLPFPNVLECLMAIHYPFYDVKKSLILNIFKVKDDASPNNYHNTLVIPRILYLLRNFGGINYGVIVDRLKKFGYPLDYIELGIDKIAQYGLIDSTNGIRRSDFHDDTLITPSEAGLYYVNKIIKTPSYLQYVCEDAVIHEKYIVPITEKYSIADDTITIKDRRADSVKLFVEFVKNEEMIEKKVIEKLKYDENSFLFEMSAHEAGKGVWIYKKLELSAITKLKILMN